SLLDNKPADLFVTELIRMEGSERFGGPAGFATASQNDLPMAAKGIIVSSAFLGVEMKCARCHDAPSHVSKQKDLLQLAAMLQQKTVKLPQSSSVPAASLHQAGRKPLIEVTLQPGASVPPSWPFDRYCDESIADTLAEHPGSSRDRLAALITAPHNERFAQVMVNRIWQRLMGRGLVATVSDWEKGEPSHPELLRWLGHRFVESGYDIKAISRLILNSHAYQRTTDPTLTETSPLYIAPAPRRLTAEQIDRGLQNIWLGLARASRILSCSAPAERFENTGYSGEHPGTSRFAQCDRILHDPDAVDIKAHFFQ
ncbi:Planctomycete cytochrome C, partial [Durusdinium trenchii]